MALFGRNNSNNDVPEDLQQYYSTGGSGIGKWLLRGLAFLVILALLIWGGVWLFNKLTDDTKTSANTQTSTSSQSDAQKKAAADAAKAQAEAKKAQQQAEAAQQKAAADAQKAQEEAKKKADQEAAQKAQQQSQTASGGNSLPNTGPGESVAVAFFGATALGALMHTIITRRRQLR